MTNAMRTSAFLLLLLLQTVLLQAQTIITGTIKDTRGLPLAGASVAIKDSYDGATADSTGAFRFATTEKGERILVVSALGYKSVEQKLTLGGTVQPLAFS